MSAGHDGAHRVEDLEREAQPVLQRAAVLVGALVGDRRQERRQQVAVRGVQLEQVEAGLDRRGGRPRRSRPRPVSRSARVASRGTWQPAPYGSGDGPTTSQLPSGSGSSMPSHISLVEPLRPEWPSWSADLGRAAARARSRRPRFQASRCSSFQSPVQPGVMRPSGETQTISVITRPAPPRALRPEVDQVEVGRHARRRRVHVHRRDDDPVLELQPADPDRLEHRGGDLVGALVPREFLLHPRREVGVAVLEVLEGDPARAGEQVEDRTAPGPGRRTCRCSRTTPATPGRRAASTRRPACARSW